MLGLWCAQQAAQALISHPAAAPPGQQKNMRLVMHVLALSSFPVSPVGPGADRFFAQLGDAVLCCAGRAGGCVGCKYAIKHYDSHLWHPERLRVARRRRGANREMPRSVTRWSHHEMSCTVSTSQQPPCCHIANMLLGALIKPCRPTSRRLDAARPVTLHCMSSSFCMSHAPGG